VRRRAIVVVFAFSAATATVGTAAAQTTASIVVQPATADPGGLVKVSNGPLAPCQPQNGNQNASASVDLYAAGSATPVNRMPYQGVVNALGAWSIDVRLAPDLPPGSYGVQAGCYSDSSLTPPYKRYDLGRLDLRLQEPGSPTLSADRGRPGESFQVGSGGARCLPPVGSPSARVRVSLVDSAKATRAEGEAAVDAATGGWSVGLRVPDLAAQTAEITAVCFARVGAPSPYARYSAAPFAVEVEPPPSPTTTTTSPPTTSPTVTATTIAPLPGATTTTATPTTVAAATTVPTTLPPTPLAVAVVAEPTYTG